MKKKDIWLLIFVLIIVGSHYFNINIFSYINEEFLYQVVSLEKNEVADIKPVRTSSKLKVYYINVGEAESILIQNLDEYMLIDAGNNNDGKKLVKFLKDLEVTDLKYVVSTHPHEDHIGGMDNIVKEKKIKRMFMPDVTTNTPTFTEVLDELEKKKVKITIPKNGDTYRLGNAEIKFIYSGTDSEDLNNSSIILKVTFGNNSFLFTGDTTSAVEYKILNEDISADVLKVAHHGSRYSSSEEFIKKVNPKYAVISVGKNNDYGHPHKETIRRLNKNKVKVYRTDYLGTILFESNGNKIDIKTIKTDTDGG